MSAAGSPAPSHDGQGSKSEKEQITFRFCRECSNMLYPKEDRINNKLMFACRTCQFSEEAASSCIFRNSIHNTIGATAGVTQDVGSDPTVGGLLCIHCGQTIESPGEEPSEDAKRDFERLLLGGDKGKSTSQGADSKKKTDDHGKAGQKLPRAIKRCPNCHESEAVFFQSQQRSAETGMVRFFRNLPRFLIP
ncbi:MAG: hypothetical protein Q9167_006553 [Letrouitia subvulpina]